MFFLLLLIPLLLGFAFFFDFGGPDDGMDGSDGDDNQGGGGTIDPGDNGTGTGGGVNGGPDDPNVTVDNTGAIQTTVDIALKGGVVAGDLHHYQLWYGDPGTPCGALFNFSNAPEITWQA